jgi:hypothetical protein
MNKCIKCKTNEVYYKTNGIHIECKCNHCNSHIKFVSKVEYEKLNLPVIEYKSLQLF